MGSGAESDVMVEPSPSSAFEMIEADLAFHFLVVAFDAPSEFHQSYEFVLGRVGGQVADSRRSRSRVPTEADHRFRGKPITDSERSRSLVTT